MNARVLRVSVITAIFRWLGVEREQARFRCGNSKTHPEVAFHHLTGSDRMRALSNASFVLTMIACWLLPCGNLNLSASENISSVPVTGQPWTIRLPDKAALDMKWIPSGRFVQGSPNDEPGRAADESPQTEVTITNGFWLGTTLVTVAQWKEIMGFGVREQFARRIHDDTLYELGGKRQKLRDFMRWSGEANPTIYLANEGDDVPMYFVSWNDATDFCKRLTTIERAAGRLPVGYEYSLPTEAQWEYGCRAGTTGATYAESHSPRSLDKIAWYEKNSADGYVGPGLGPTHSGPREVSQKQPNAWGLFDMYGNVWQWCHDWYGAYPGGNVTDSAEPKSGTLRVNRGGSFGSGANSLRSAARASNPPAEASAYRGFRIALSLVMSR